MQHVARVREAPTGSRAGSSIVSGRRNRPDTRIGPLRLEGAAGDALLAFAGDAYLNEIGITSRLFPKENAPNGNAAAAWRRSTPVADPEDAVDPMTGKADIDHFADFMRLLAPPPRLPADAFRAAPERIMLSADRLRRGATCRQ